MSNPPILAQYANSPALMALVQRLSDALDAQPLLDEFYRDIWNVDTARGYGLDVWGRIVGVGRVLLVPDDATYFGFLEAGDAEGFGVAPFFGTGPLTSNYALSDDAYRRLIYAKALANISNGGTASINRILRLLFPGYGRVWVIDHLDMTMTYRFQNPLNPVDYAIVTQSGVLPRPAGVTATVVLG